jgi:chromate transport protein ChrA
MKKNNKFWVMILIGVGIIILLMVVSSAISLGEKLRTIHPLVEIGFYVLYAVLVYVLIINPIRIILFAPTFSITTTMDEEHHASSHVYRKVAKNRLKTNYQQKKKHSA